MSSRRRRQRRRQGYAATTVLLVKPSRPRPKVSSPPPSSPTSKLRSTRTKPPVSRRLKGFLVAKAVPDNPLGPLKRMQRGIRNLRQVAVGLTDRAPLGALKAKYRPSLSLGKVPSLRSQNALSRCVEPPDPRAGGLASAKARYAPKGAGAGSSGVPKPPRPFYLWCKDPVLIERRR